MRQGQSVTAPDGAQWLVRRRWFDRPVPNLWKRFQAARSKHLEDDAFGGALTLGVEGWGGIVLAVVVILIVFVLLPLLGVALELIVVIFLLCSGLFGRLVFGRPWTVEALERGGRGRSVSVQVKGWRRAGEVAGELAREIAVGGRPESIEVPGRR